jgi:hypothetical protein
MLDELIKECRLLLDRIQRNYEPGLEGLPPSERITIAELKAWYKGVTEVLKQLFGAESAEAQLWRDGLERIRRDSWEGVGRISPRGGHWVIHNFSESLGLLAQIRLLKLKQKPPVGRPHETNVLEPLQIRFYVNQPIPIEETRHYEFKEVTGKNPISAIVNASDEYAVAFLNSGGGRIFWGVRNADRVAIGVRLDYEQRDRVRRQVWEKLFTIQPATALTHYRVELHPLYDGTEEIHDPCVVELVVPAGDPRSLYLTASSEVFVKTDGGKKKLTLQEILEEDRRRRGT